ncbi:MAG: glycoside hydrolase family 38 C-terminal domain-containing protein [Candidatus Thorarchaeota archaeon]
MEEKIVIIPHTHWDREWYLPFQRFRAKLIELIDNLLEIIQRQEYYFMLDGQTVILEDYFEIRPERREELLKAIREQKIAIGPWYVLADQWLVGGESLIRNLEYSHDLSQRMEIPLMDIAYLPDQFGHTSAIPQIFGDLTSLRSVVLWRGVPPDIMTVPFMWRSHPNSKAALLGVYMPGGYGNVSRLPESYDEFKERVDEVIEELQPFSPFPVYQLMNGSDHLFPQPFVHDHVTRLREEGRDIILGGLREYVSALKEAIDEAHYTPPSYEGEMRSPARAPLLQDTYSARMWIKLWNQRVEDLLCKKVEPISTCLWLYLDSDYPTKLFETAWKWLLRNHPHDSICGCSIDRTHDEMKTRFSWAETIAESVVERATQDIIETSSLSEESSIIVFNPTGVSNIPLYVEFTQPGDVTVNGIRDPSGKVYPVQALRLSDSIFMDMTVGLRTAKMGMKLITGRKLTSFYINGVEFFDGDEPGLLELRLIADTQQIGEFDIEGMKRQAREIIGSGRYKRVHVVAARPTQRRYATCLPLPALSFSSLRPVADRPQVADENWQVTEDGVSNRFYEVHFNKDGTLNMLNKESGQRYDHLHAFEDFGDRGDEYTFGRVLPEKAKVKRVRREITINGPAVAEIRQDIILELFEGLDDTREKRIGKVELKIETRFRFYKDDRRIDITTKLTNSARDHRLRVCFDLPFRSEFTKTATHFGYIERQGAPERIPEPAELDRTHSSYPEMPSGVQPQKRFIRVDDLNGTDAITVFNKGMPEVELVDGQRIAVTMIRSIGWLSRSDFQERPIHAGPAEETPGAQELGVKYEFHYGLVIHSKNDPITLSADYADSSAEKVLSISLEKKEAVPSLLRPIVTIDNPAVRVSSLRVREESILVTLYNLTPEPQRSFITLTPEIAGVKIIKIDGSTLSEIPVEDNSLALDFAPREIKLCQLKKRSD